MLGPGGWDQPLSLRCLGNPSRGFPLDPPYFPGSASGAFFPSPQHGGYRSAGKDLYGSGAASARAFRSKADCRTSAGIDGVPSDSDPSAVRASPGCGRESDLNSE